MTDTCVEKSNTTLASFIKPKTQMLMTNFLVLKAKKYLIGGVFIHAELT